MSRTLGEIARHVGGTMAGDGSVPITGCAGLKEAKAGELSFLSNVKYAGLLKETKASGIIVGLNDAVGDVSKNLIRVAHPSLAFSKASALFMEPHPNPIKGIHPSAVVAASAEIGEGVAIGPHAVIEDGVHLGRGTVIGAGVFIGFKSVIGEGTLIYPNVTVRERSLIGSRVIIHSGTVIGSDGFGFETVDGVHHKIPQIGIVEVQDDVEIGANVTVDRARFDRTVIGRGTKIDNLVQIAHNVRIGRGCLIVAQAGIAGSTVIGDYVVIGGQVGVAGHLTIADGVMVAAQSGVAESVPEKTILFGSPARPHILAKRIHASLGDLPEQARRLRLLEERIAELEKKQTGER